jgi:hypothetical protein
VLLPRFSKWQALMEGVGDAEREILWQTAKLRVFSYERHRHNVVPRFLSTLLGNSAPTRVGDYRLRASGRSARFRRTACRTLCMVSACMVVRPIG